jgi:glycerol-3-phosphate acyltransferase PlsX
MKRIAVDAMGGDNAPAPEVEGALWAIRDHALEVILVGDEAILRGHLARAGRSATGPGRITIKHASQVVTMEDSPGLAFKSKKDSSMRVCFDLAARGDADAVVGAGNSGAMMAFGLFVMKRVRGVDRPGLMTLCPTKKPGPNAWCVVLDLGANVEVKPSNLVQFAVLGATYARKVLGVERPRVGVLSNGAEDSKGTDLTREVHRVLGAARSDDFTFAGYAEGGDFFPGGFDVVVTDGFTGNIALKTSEGTTRAIFDLLEAEIRKRSRFKLGALLLKPALRALKRRLESDEYGGALLLGVDGVAVIAHGSANAKAVKNAILAADRFVEAGLLPALAEAVERNRRLWSDDDSSSANAAGG